MITHAPRRAFSASRKPAGNGGCNLGECYRTLLHRLRWPGGDDSRPLATLGITSCHGGEGVSTVAANLAVTAAGLGDRRVVLVDCNLGGPSLERTFGIEPEPGLGEALADGDRLADTIQASPVANLSLISAGNMGRAATVDQGRLVQLIDRLKQDHDLIVFDMPAAARSSNAIPLAGLLDGVLLVVEAERIRWEVARRTKDLLVEAGAHLLGVVLNKRQDHVPDWLYRTL